MFVYYNINSVKLENIMLQDKVKNKISNGYYYRINYNTEIYSLDSLIIKLDLNNVLEVNEFINFEKSIISKLNIGKLNPVLNFNRFINKFSKKVVYIKLCGFYSNNYNYGIIYKLINVN